MKKLRGQSEGQGLVEYALILVLVAVVVIAILTILGPQVGNVFSRVVAGLGGGTSAVVVPPPPPSASITSASFHVRSGNLVTLNVFVSADTTVTLTDSQGGSATTSSCSSSCQPTITVGGPNSGTITVTIPGDSASVFYPAPP